MIGVLGGRLPLIGNCVVAWAGRPNGVKTSRKIFPDAVVTAMTPTRFRKARREMNVSVIGLGLLVDEVLGRHHADGQCPGRSVRSPRPPVHVTGNRLLRPRRHLRQTSEAYRSG